MRRRLTWEETLRPVRHSQVRAQLDPRARCGCATWTAEPRSTGRGSAFALGVRSREEEERGALIDNMYGNPYGMQAGYSSAMASSLSGNGTDSRRAVGTGSGRGGADVGKAGASLGGLGSMGAVGYGVGTPGSIGLGSLGQPRQAQNGARAPQPHQAYLNQGGAEAAYQHAAAAANPYAAYGVGPPAPQGPLTNQERINEATMTIDNPNVVGSGYIRHPPQKRFQANIVQQPLTCAVEYETQLSGNPQAGQQAPGRAPSATYNTGGQYRPAPTHPAASGPVYPQYNGHPMPPQQQQQHPGYAPAPAHHAGGYGANPYGQQAPAPGSYGAAPGSGGPYGQAPAARGHYARAPSMAQQQPIAQQRGPTRQVVRPSGGRGGQGAKAAGFVSVPARAVPSGAGGGVAARANGARTAAPAVTAAAAAEKKPPKLTKSQAKRLRKKKREAN